MITERSQNEKGIKLIDLSLKVRAELPLFSIFQLESIPLIELINDPGFRIISAVTKTIKDKDYVEIKFSVNSPSSWIKSGRVLLDPSFYWALKEYEFKAKDDEEWMTYSFKIDLQKYQNQYVFPRNVIILLLYDSDPNYKYTRTYHVTNSSFNDVKDEEFELPHYGIGDYRQFADSDSVFTSWLFWFTVSIVALSTAGTIYYKKRAL